MYIFVIHFNRKNVTIISLQCHFRGVLVKYVYLPHILRTLQIYDIYLLQFRGRGNRLLYGFDETDTYRTPLSRSTPVSRNSHQCSQHFDHVFNSTAVCIINPGSQEKHCYAPMTGVTVFFKKSWAPEFDARLVRIICSQ